MTERATKIETYTPLYRKYRPKTFADLVGQEAVSRTLGNAIQLNKVAHAYLFCGPRGTGKTSTARIFAKSLNCEQGPSFTPCLQCPSCVGVAQGTALDVIEFDAASNNGVADARELIENCQYGAIAGRFKIYIIDEVHMLTSQAFNALLKTLEEPPPNVIFIFATTEAHKVLPTIISRCQRFDFSRITVADIRARLSHIAQSEAIQIDEEALETIARHARGGLRDAVGLLDQVAVLGRARPDASITRKDVALFIGTLEEERLLRLSESIARRQAAELLNEVDALLTQGIEPIQLLRDLTLHFRHLLVVQAAGDQAGSEALSLPEDYYRQLLAQAALFPDPEELPQIIGRLAAVERNVRQGFHPQLWLESGLLELAYRHDIERIKTLSARVEELEKRLEALSAGSLPMQPPQSAPATKAPVSPSSHASHPTPAVQPAIATPGKAHASASSARVAASSGGTASAQGRPVSTSGSAAGKPAPSLEALYVKICADIPSLLFRSLLQQQTFPISLEGDSLMIGCRSEVHLATIKKPDKWVHLQKAAEKALGSASVRLEIILEKDAPQQAGPPAVMAESLPPARVETRPVAQPEKPPFVSPPLRDEPPVFASPPSVREEGKSENFPDGRLPEPPDDDEEEAIFPSPDESEMSSAGSEPGWDHLPADGSEDSAWREARLHVEEVLQGRVLE